ncbi:MAG: GDP-mannose 4,6-dehydratase [Bryobacterales bacterium]|nr:GDP-mannose 4,6-dehydratase [Bryobacterales bacterium]
MKTWVTGGGGFLGSHIVEALAALGRSVTVIDDFSTGREANLAAAGERTKICRQSLLDPEVERLLGVERPGVIFHLAGDALVSRSVADPRGDCDRNLLATLALLEAVRRVSPESKVLFASTGAVYGEHAERPFQETDGVCPISPYAVAKLAAERYCYAYAHTYGLRTCSLRLFSVYGPRQEKQVVYDLIRKLWARPEELSLFGDGTEERDFSHALNIVDAFLLAEEKAGFGGEVFNVAGDETVSIRTLAEMLRDAMGTQSRLMFSGQRRPGDSRRWVADTTRLRALGYRPRVKLRDGLRDTIEWYLRSQE